MIKCIHCGFENQDGVNFCENCGKSLGIIKEIVAPKMESKVEKNSTLKPKLKNAKSTNPVNLKWTKSLLYIIPIVLVLVTAFLFRKTLLQKLGADVVKKEYYMVISGSNTIGQKLMPALCKKYLLSKMGAKTVSQIKNETGQIEISGNIVINGEIQEVTILIDPRGSSYAFSQLDSGLAEIGMSSREVRLNDFKDLAKYNAVSGQGGEFEIAIDAIAVTVNSSNSLQNISLNDLASIYAGNNKQWSELGSKMRGNINAYTLNDHSGTFQLFKESVLDASGLKLDTAIVKRNFSNDSIADIVKSTENAIGVISYSAAQKQKMLSIQDENGLVFPNLFNISLREYPLVRSLYLYINPTKANNKVKEFVEFCQTQCEEVISESGFISHNFQTMPNDPSYKISPFAIDADRKEYLGISENHFRLNLDLMADANGNLLAETENKARNLSSWIGINKSSYKEIVLLGLDYLNTDKKATDNAVSQMYELFKPFGLKVKSISLGNVVKPITRFAAYSPIHFEIWLQ